MCKRFIEYRLIYTQLRTNDTMQERFSDRQELRNRAYQIVGLGICTPNSCIGYEVVGTKIFPE